MADAALAHGFEICSHGYHWIDYQYQEVPEAVEREPLQRAVEIIRQLACERPLGWYTGRTGPHTRRLVVQEGGFAVAACHRRPGTPSARLAGVRPVDHAPFLMWRRLARQSPGRTSCAPS